jgi:TPR repeat protein
MLKRLALGVSIALLLTGTALAGPLEEGVAAYKDGDFSQAISLWRQASEQGNLVARFNLGMAYELGWGVDRDSTEAVRWYLSAAHAGDVLSMAKLGNVFSEGTLVARDYDAAAKWYTMAADRNHVRAHYNLGTLYANGTGVAKNVGKAFELYERAESMQCTYGDVALIHEPRLT